VFVGGKMGIEWHIRITNVPWIRS